MTGIWHNFLACCKSKFVTNYLWLKYHWSWTLEEVHLSAHTTRITWSSQWTRSLGSMFSHKKWEKVVKAIVVPMWIRAQLGNFIICSPIRMPLVRSNYGIPCILVGSDEIKLHYDLHNIMRTLKKMLWIWGAPANSKMVPAFFKRIHKTQRTIYIVHAMSMTIALLWSSSYNKVGFYGSKPFWLNYSCRMITQVRYWELNNSKLGSYQWWPIMVYFFRYYLGIYNEDFTYLDTNKIWVTN